MNRFLYLLWLLPMTAYSLDRAVLDRMLRTAAEKTGKDYVAARETITARGAEALPLLAEAGTDARLPWQQRLMARICYERIAKGAEIEKLRQYDWRSDPQYNPKWEANIMGPVAHAGELVIPRCEKEGLWYYYIELTWKRTGEICNQWAPRLPECWPKWCRDALKRQPERWYLLQAIFERLENDKDLTDQENVSHYDVLFREKEVEAVPVLAKLHEAFLKRALPGLKLSAEERRSALENIFGFANAGHRDVIEKFIAENPDYLPLTNKLAAVSARPAPPSPVEPPFRLGQRPVKP